MKEDEIIKLINIAIVSVARKSNTTIDYIKELIKKIIYQNS